MKIDIQDVTETRKTLAVSFEGSEVEAEENSLIKEFSKQAKIPGFRPGKAPANMIRQRYGKNIAGELRQRLISKAYQEGSKESGLKLINVVDLEDPKIEAGQDAELKFTVDIEPEFELAEYKGIEATGLSEEVAAEDIDKMIDQVRGERAEFEPVEREAAKGDYVKFSHEGSIDGTPISEIAPEKPVYAKMPQTWEEIGSEHGLIPGLSEGLEGLKTGDKKEIEVTFPEDFTVEALQGKKAVYAVEVQEVREKKLPEMDEAFFKSQGAENLEGFRERVEAYLKMQKTQERRSDIRRQVSEALAAKIDFPLPESLVDQETEAAMRNIVQSNVRKGVPQEELEKNKDEIHAESRAAAAESVKLQLILGKIAEKEELKVEDSDFSQYIMNRAQQSGQKPDAIVKELRKDSDQVRRIQSSLLFDKTLEFLVDQAKVS